MRLRTLRDTSSPHPAIPHRYSGLDDLKTGPFRIPIRIDKTRQPILLVRLKKMITDR